MLILRSCPPRRSLPASFLAGLSPSSPSPTRYRISLTAAPAGHTVCPLGRAPGAFAPAFTQTRAMKRAEACAESPTTRQGDVRGRTQQIPDQPRSEEKDMRRIVAVVAVVLAVAGMVVLAVVGTPIASSQGEGMPTVYTFVSEFQ